MEKRKTFALFLPLTLAVMFFYFSQTQSKKSRSPASETVEYLYYIDEQNYSIMYSDGSLYTLVEGQPTSSFMGDNNVLYFYKMDEKNYSYQASDGSIITVKNGDVTASESSDIPGGDFLPQAGEDPNRTNESDNDESYEESAQGGKAGIPGTCWYGNRGLLDLLSFCQLTLNFFTSQILPIHLAGESKTFRPQFATDGCTFSISVTMKDGGIVGGDSGENSISKMTILPASEKSTISFKEVLSIAEKQCKGISLSSRIDGRGKPKTLPGKQVNFTNDAPFIVFRDTFSPPAKKEKEFLQKGVDGTLIEQ